MTAQTTSSGSTILLLTASVGVGHTAAAAAVGEALSAQNPRNRVEILDSYRYAAAVFSKVVADGYIGMVKSLPQLYRYLYDRAERATEVGRFRNWMNQFTASNLRTVMETHKPDAVLCTHAFPCGVMSEYKKQYADAPPVIGIVTDFAVHPFWLYRNIDGYAVATEELRASLVGRGIAAERVIASGIPIARAFGETRVARSVLRESLQLPQSRSMALLMGGGLGIGPLEMMIRALDKVRVPLSAVAITGRNPRAGRRVLEAAQRVGYPLRVLSFVENVYDYMHAADLLLSKPGGLTVSEAFAAGLPLVVVKPLPGQEERNTRFLIEHGAALRARNEAALTRAVEGFLGSPERRARMQERVASLARPSAADDIAAFVAGICAERGPRIAAG